ncbi:MAG: hypothetical protein M5U18_08295 [Dehalococcoidia bacterium]|nr:hypothetical protein [Dehalococcoidia bacterium]
MTDNTRWQRKTPRSSSLEETLEETATFYRREIWDNQPEYVEIWSEKDAISGVILPVTNGWHVPLMVTRGYPSLSFMYESAQSMLAAGRRVHVGYLGDLDPSGVDIRRNVERRLREFGAGIDPDFQVLGVTRDQVSEYSLLTRPTKKSDSRSQNFSGESVEVDAIEPDELRRLVEEFIVHFVDQGRLAHLRLAEESERQILRGVASCRQGLR